MRLRSAGAIDGVDSMNSATLLFLLLSISLVSAMIKASGISSEFVWLATELNQSGGAYVAVEFLVVCVIAMAAGSSIGTMLTVFPILYPAGVAVGAQPVLLAGALLSGALFDDNLALSRTPP